MFLYNLNNIIYDYKRISNDVFCSAILYGLMAPVNSQSGSDPVMRVDRNLISPSDSARYPHTGLSLILTEMWDMLVCRRNTVPVLEREPCEGVSKAGLTGYRLQLVLT